MSYWNYENIGASARPENKKYIQKIFKYIGISDRPGYSPYEERTFTNPAVYGCFYDEHKDNTGEFMSRVHLFGPDDLLYILNALFPKTKVYSHSAEGNDTSDTWENHSRIYDADSMTLYGKDSYTSYSGDGPSGEQTWKERFVMKPPELKHIEVLAEISAADGNEEITGLLQDLLRKLKDGQIVYAEDPGDKRKVGEKYDVSGHVTEPEDEEEAFNRFYDSVIEKMPYHKFIELYKMDPESTSEDDYRNALVAEHRLEFAECLCNLVRSAESGVVDALAVNVPAHVVFLVIRAGKSGVVIILLAPVFVSGHERVLIRVVVDFGHHVAFASRVGRPACAEHRSIVHFGTRSLHNQGAGVVVAACATHRSDECIVVALQNLHTGVVECPLAACAPRVVHARFVGACEEKVFVIVFKIRCNLSPECGLASLDGC